MAALVQSFPQQPSSVTMLQARPASASGPYPTTSQLQQQPRGSQTSRSVYTGVNGNIPYRGHGPPPSTTTYAFAVPPMPMRPNYPPSQLRYENRTFSAPVVPTTPQPMSNSTMNHSRQRQAAPAPRVVSTGDLAINNGPNHQIAAKDDSSIARPLSMFESGTLDPKLATLAMPVKISPDRYRRNNRRVEMSHPTFAAPGTGGSAMPSGSGMATVGHLYNYPRQATEQQSYRGFQKLNQENAYLIPGVPVSKDDMSITRQPASEQAKRYRRRSIGGLEVGEFASHFVDPREPTTPWAQPKPHGLGSSTPHVPEKTESKPVYLSHGSTILSHGRKGSEDSTSSSRSGSRPSSSKRETSGVVTIGNPTALQGTPIAKHEAKLVYIPPRGSSDASKRLTNPSPLSKPMALSHDPPATKSSFAALAQSKAPQAQPYVPQILVATAPESAAAQQLTALSQKEAKKEGKSSRLRRAFSFGSAAELRKASAENNHNNNVSAERAKLRKDRYQDEREAEQAAIAQKQEAAGLGEGIYSGQGNFCTGSTDNLSISSTASSASVMLRKMGKGVKRSTRSLVGLFRPKSVVGVQAADAAVPGPSLAQVSMVTVEAEREQVNINVNPHDHAGGGTGYPKLERNSIDAASAVADEQSLCSIERGGDMARPRQSIVGGEKERAEVLAAVKKGILKRNNTDPGLSSLASKSSNAMVTSFPAPHLPNYTESPNSSAPSTPRDDMPTRSNHRRTDSVTIEGEDYFVAVARFANSDSRSLPGTSRSVNTRNISFSPRIQFHDTWPSGEYDRRGEIATCNRLTPMLAQQIKEELNSFKMEMEVHVQSKENTHFF